MKPCWQYGQTLGRSPVWIMRWFSKVFLFLNLWGSIQFIFNILYNRLYLYSRVY